MQSAPVHLFPEMFSSSFVVFFSLEVLFVISVATYYFSKDKPTDNMHLHNNVIGHWLQTSFRPPFSMEDKPSSQVLMFWCHRVGLGWGVMVLRNGGIRP